jgi:hypothetical protein
LLTSLDVDIQPLIFNTKVDFRGVFVPDEGTHAATVLLLDVLNLCLDLTVPLFHFLQGFSLEPIQSTSQHLFSIFEETIIGFRPLAEYRRFQSLLFLLVFILGEISHHE